MLTDQNQQFPRRPCSSASLAESRLAVKGLSNLDSKRAVHHLVGPVPPVVHKMLTPLMEYQVMERARKLRDKVTAAMKMTERPWERDRVLPRIRNMPPIEVIVMQTPDILIHEPGAVTVSEPT